jgi:hypothetical protein
MEKEKEKEKEKALGRFLFDKHRRAISENA